MQFMRRLPTSPDPAPTISPNRKSAPQFLPETLPQDRKFHLPVGQPCRRPRPARMTATLPRIASARAQNFGFLPEPRARALATPGKARAAQKKSPANRPGFLISTQPTWGQTTPPTRRYRNIGPGTKYASSGANLRRSRRRTQFAAVLTLAIAPSTGLNASLATFAYISPSLVISATKPS